MVTLRMRNFICLLLVCTVSVGWLGVDAGAVQMLDQEATVESERASGRFSMEVYAHEVVAADMSFPLEAKESVTINASYSPLSASVDFGLIAPDGLFYSVNVTDGSINKTIRVKERGYYTLAVRNNSDFDISVSGFVVY